MPGLLKGIAVFSVAIVAGFQAASAEDLSPTLQKIKESGAITLGYRDASIPMSYTDAEAQPAGFALDLCALVVSKVEQTLGLPDLKISYRPVAAVDAPALLQNGTIAIDCSATPVSTELSRPAVFSNPIFVSELRWMVPQRLRVEREGARRNWFETISPSSTEDLKGMPVVLTRGSAATSLVLTISSDRSLGLSILEAKDNAESFKLVETGKVSAFLADSVPLVSLKANAKNPGAFSFLGEAYPGSSYALMLGKDDRTLKNMADGVLSEAMRSGEYAKLYAKWFESPIPPRNVNLAYPMPEALKALVQAAANQPAAR